jgi:hypothetical protein
VASYIGMIPCEHTSGKRQRLGKLTKEGNSLLRYLWTEATIHAESFFNQQPTHIGITCSGRCLQAQRNPTK